MTQVTKLMESTAIIRFPDCDPFNHLNNSRYIDYFINAREDHLMEHESFSPFDMIKETGLSWVVTQSQIAYIRPANLLETVVIQSHIIEWNDKSIRVEMLMWNRDKTELKSVFWTVFTHFNVRTGRSEKHSEELHKRFIKYYDPLEKEMSFDERVAELRMVNFADAAANGK